MLALIVVVLSIVLPLVHLALSRAPRNRARTIHLLLLYALVFDVGVIGLPLGFVPHVFFPDQAARQIGWPPGSPFQLEVGFHEHDLVIGGKLRFELLSGDPAGMVFHNSGQRMAWLTGQRRQLDRSEAHTIWQIRADEYRQCRNVGGSNCFDPGPDPGR